MIAVNLVLIVVLALIAWRLFGRTAASVVRGVCAGVIANAVTFMAVTFGPRHAFVYEYPHGVAFPVLYLVVGLVVGAGVLWLMRIALKRRFVPAETKWRIRDIFPIVIGGVFGALIGLFYFVPKTIIESVDGVTAAQLLFIVTQGNGETTVANNWEFTNYMVAPIIWLTLVGMCVGAIRTDLLLSRRGTQAVDGTTIEPQAPQNTSADLQEIDPPALAENEQFSENPAPSSAENLAPTSGVTAMRRFTYVRGVAMGTMLALVVGSVTYAFQVLPLGDIVRQHLYTSTYVADNWVMPTKQSVQLPEKKRNLIHIYMESIENSFYSRDMGGYLNRNVMPELAELTKEGVSFSNTDLYGGPQQMYATGHSVAAMVAMWAGTPMLSSGAGNGTQMSFPDFPTIGDYLNSAGYATDFMLGSDSRWGGLGDYYRRHGNFTVHDLNTFKDEGRIPRDYSVWWGVEDDKLYEYAKELMAKRGAEGKPFYFVLENADTHFPDGYPSPLMTEKPFGTQYENVIHYSQKETVKLVRWIQAQPWAKDTTIVITGDHRSMDKNFFRDWDPDYNRTVVNMILNPVQGTDLPTSITNNRQYGSFDFYPTILASIGAKIDGERLGLGTNLFSGKKTLVERDGATHMNEEFAKTSKFYDKHRETVAATPDRRQDDKL
ncbi:phosphoglycerol transferase [Arcanobacterium wilhelmae]|uniref:Phosphoglycerol transferase n=1 Tax=Arcanobacterium wilhelmae TaxID=1803177 RepID=A0ABT9NB36_9ACTO|nr:LTA synthase family protein [Arcanobacterium wilhelmae]MDP9800733.1 phosphoglycerol transferase [Arcanobacterium wilhelmae]